MGFWARLFGGGVDPVVTPIGALACGGGEVEGTTALLEPIFDPVHGEPAIAVRYEARGPSTTASLYGGIAGPSGDFVAQADQATDFLLQDGTGTALIRVPRGADLRRVHAQALHNHGMSLRASVELLRAGERVRVWGEIIELCEGSPHRRMPYTAVIRAEGFKRC